MTCVWCVRRCATTRVETCTPAPHQEGATRATNSRARGCILAHASALTYPCKLASCNCNAPTRQELRLCARPTPAEHDTNTIGLASSVRRCLPWRIARRARTCVLPDCEVAPRTLTRLRSNVKRLRTTPSVGLHLRSLPNCAPNPARVDNAVCPCPCRATVLPTDKVGRNADTRRSCPA